MRLLILCLFLIGCAEESQNNRPLSCGKGVNSNWIRIDNQSPYDFTGAALGAVTLIKLYNEKYSCEAFVGLDTACEGRLTIDANDALCEAYAGDFNYYIQDSVMAICNNSDCFYLE